MKVPFSIFFIFFCIILGNAQNVSSIVKRICSQSGIKAQIPLREPLVPVRTSCSGQTTVSYTDFYLLKIKSGTTFTFKITPDQPIDYDFMCWLNPDLKNLGVADRASQNNPFKMTSPTFDTGLLTTTTEECQPINSIGSPEPGYLKYLSVKTGDIIVIAVDMVEDSGQSGYILELGGDAVLGCALEYEECDTDNDQKVVFNLNDIRQDILSNVYQNPQLKVNFFDSQKNAVNNNDDGLIDFIKDVSTKIVSSVIFARLEDQENKLKDIFDIQLRAKAIPQVSNVHYFPKCDADGNSVEIFDLALLLPYIIGSQQEVETHFYISENDALEGNNGYIQNPSFYFTSGTTVYLRLQNQNGCYVVTPIQLAVVQNTDTIQEITAVSLCKTLEEAKDINLYDFIPDYSGNPFYQIKLYKDKEDALEQNADFVLNPEHYQMDTDVPLDLYADIYTGSCRQILHFTAMVNSKPEITLNSELSLCEGNSAKLEAYTNIDSVVYWYDNPESDLPIFKGNVFNTPEIYQTRKYYAEARSKNGCTSIRKEVLLTAISSLPPKIYNIETGKDYLYINAISSSKIEYSINGTDWQSSAYFKSLMPGVYKVFVRNESGCSSISDDIVLVGISNFISPNGDGINDRWILRGMENFPQADLKIFDRYGKTVFDSAKSQNFEWNGKSDHRVLPTGTYWFVLKLSAKKQFDGQILLKNY